MRMPYAPGNRWWLKRVLGARTQPEWNKTEKVWEISRGHLMKLAEAMADRFGEVDIFIDSRPINRCDIRCVEAVGSECECQCNGRNHGGLVASTEHWVEVGETTLIQGGEINRRHFRLRKDGTVTSFL